ncbi:MAG: hypothetical protein FH756_13930 [Firmicutes bacterium]|nr:hypothetical protein [Bacillota bacterium]
MSVSVSPVVVGVAIIIVTNFFLGLGQSNVMKKGYMMISSILSLIGIVGIIFTRAHLISSLNKQFGNSVIKAPIIDSNFMPVMIKKFDYFAGISISATCLVVIFLCYLLLTNKKVSIVSSNLSSFVNVFRIVIFLFGVWYSIGTVNKFFDLGAYIVTLSIMLIFVLYIPLIVKRMITYRKRDL